MVCSTLMFYGWHRQDTWHVLARQWKNSLDCRWLLLPLTLSIPTLMCCIPKVICNYSLHVLKLSPQSTEWKVRRSWVVMHLGSADATFPGAWHTWCSIPTWLGVLPDFFFCFCSTGYLLWQSNTWHVGFPVNCRNFRQFTISGSAWASICILSKDGRFKSTPQSFWFGDRPFNCTEGGVCKV